MEKKTKKKTGGGSEGVVMSGFVRKVQFMVYGSANFGTRGYLNGVSAVPDPMETPEMRDRICVVTGANSGIGFEVTAKLVAQGAHVVAVCRRNDEDAMALLNESCAKGGRVSLSLCDISSRTDCMRLVAELSTALPRIDLLVHNAGVMLAAEETAEGMCMYHTTSVYSPLLRRRA